MGRIVALTVKPQPPKVGSTQLDLRKGFSKPIFGKDFLGRCYSWDYWQVSDDDCRTKVTRGCVASYGQIRKWLKKRTIFPGHFTETKVSWRLFSGHSFMIIKESFDSSSRLLGWSSFFGPLVFLARRGKGRKKKWATTPSPAWTSRRR